MTDTNENLTIRDHIVKIQNELFESGDMLEMVIASKKAVELATLYSRIVRLLCEKEIVYKRKLEEICLANKDKSATYAKIRAEATSEYAEWKEVEANLRAVQEMKRSLTRFSKASEQDYWNQK